MLDVKFKRCESIDAWAQKYLRLSDGSWCPLALNDILDAMKKCTPRLWDFDESLKDEYLTYVSIALEFIDDHPNQGWGRIFAHRTARDFAEAPIAPHVQRIGMFRYLAQRLMRRTGMPQEDTAAAA